MFSTEVEQENEEHWIAVSDLMSGLMIVFLLISVMYLVIVEQKNEEIERVVVLYEDLREELYQDLYAEFEQDLPRWGAQLDEDLRLRFTNTDLLFELGESSLRDEFAAIIDDFFPRYLAILASDQYRDEIQEVRIEGHTSSAWSQAEDNDDAYMRNMALSQARTRSALGYIMDLEAVSHEKQWLRERLTANGLSSSQLITRVDGSEDEDRSRRVEFVVVTDAETRLSTILQEIR
ncbi:MAG: OmpA family protein [Proteobacteria bacterium]|nr:OmpA family protein [Pseudomonadota bacterium]MDA0927039.1 OmpA family protein [Pseudomonadota bacterium]